MARFSTKESTSKTSLGIKELRNIKLDPLNGILTTKNEKQAILASVNSISIKKKIRKVRTMKNNVSESVCLIKNQKIKQAFSDKTKETVLLLQSVDDFSSASVEFDKISERQSQFVEKDQKTLEEIGVLWKYTSVRLRNSIKNDIFHSFHWQLYSAWKKSMIRGVKKIENKWKSYIESIVLIQKTVKMHCQRTKFLKSKKAAKTVETWIKSLHFYRKFLKVRALARSLSKYAK